MMYKKTLTKLKIKPAIKILVQEKELMYERDYYILCILSVDLITLWTENPVKTIFLVLT